MNVRSLAASTLLVAIKRFQHTRPKFDPWLKTARPANPAEAVMATDSSTLAREDRGIALVTGASRGIGAAVARLLGKQGYHVAVNYKASSSAASTVVGDITSDGGAALAFQADVAVEADVVRLFQEVSSAWPQKSFTALVNNAGVLGNRLAKLEDIDTDSFQEIFTTNVLGPLICCREFAKVATRGAAIVNISSGSAVIGKPGLYGMTKGALNSMQAWLVQDLTPKGIRMNTVSPGVTSTDMTTDMMTTMDPKTIPEGRFGEPEEIASGVAYLLSKDASYVAGANLRISGGRTPGTFIG